MFKQKTKSWDLASFLAEGSKAPTKEQLQKKPKASITITMYSFTPILLTGYFPGPVPAIPSIGPIAFIAVGALAVVALIAAIAEKSLAKKGYTFVAVGIDTAFRILLPIAFVWSLVYFLLIKNPFL